jgi:branched-chain amino acid transport system substrate-binding protein
MLRPTRFAAAVTAASLGLSLSACAAFSEDNDASGPVTIGLSTPLSGPAASLGENERNGVELAIDQINSDGGVLDGTELELAAEDNACNPTDGVGSVSKLITQEDATAVIGALCSGVTLAAMPLVQRNKVPMVVATSTSPDITTQAGAGGNEYTFRINPSDATLAEALATYLADEGSVGRLSILAEDSTYGRGGAAAFQKALEAEGIEVVGVDYVAQGTADFSTQISKYRSDGTEAVGLYVSGADHLGFLHQAADADLGLPVTGRVELEGENLEILQDKQFAGSSSVYPYSSMVETPANHEFVEAYEKEYGSAPTYESFEGYNAVLVIADAVERAGSADPEDLRDALAETDFESLTGGTISFDDHHQAHDKAFILRLDDGQVVVAADVTT